MYLNLKLQIWRSGIPDQVVNRLQYVERDTKSVASEPFRVRAEVYPFRKSAPPGTEMAAACPIAELELYDSAWEVAMQQDTRFRLDIQFYYEYEVR